MPTHTSRVLKWSLIFGIVIVLNMFFSYTLSLVYHEPQYNNYCPVSNEVAPVSTKAECFATGGQWNANNYPTPAGVTTPAPAGYCNVDFTCGNDFNTAQSNYDRNVFIALVVLGAITVALGNFLRGNELLGQALSLSGVLSFIIASMRYWSYAGQWLKVVILAIALAILIWVAIKKFKDQ